MTPGAVVTHPDKTPFRLSRDTLAAAVRTLARRDPALRKLVRRDGAPPLWVRPATFATLLRIVLEQQVSLASARATFARLKSTAGVVSPLAVLALGADGLRDLGFTRQKAGYAVALARRIASGALELSRLARACDDTAREALMQVRGVGRWTADIYLLWHAYLSERPG